MSDDSKGEVPDNVIRVNFGAPRTPAPAAAPPAPAASYDAQIIPEDLLAQKKLEVFEKFIDMGMVSVTFDTRVPGVSVPPQFRGRPSLVLNFSHRFGLSDFTYDGLAVCASLSFGGQAFYCVVPWAAVKMLLSHHDNAVAVFDESVLF